MKSQVQLHDSLQQALAFFLTQLKALRVSSAACVWPALAFILFLLLGPFATPAVLLGLILLAREEQGRRRAEPARL